MLFGCAAQMYPSKINKFIIVLFRQHGGATGWAKDMSAGALAPRRPPCRTAIDHMMCLLSKSMLMFVDERKNK